MMTRHNYDNFVSSWKKEDIVGFIFQDKYTDPECPNSISKIRKDHTTYLEYDEHKQYNFHRGIYVDIFVADRAPKGRIASKLQMIAYALCRVSCRNKCSNKYHGIERILEKLILGLPVRTRLKIYDWANRFSQNWNDKNGEFVLGWSQKASTERLPSDLFDSVRDYKFEGGYYKGIKDYDVFLSLHYGNYMELPPKSERVITHHPLIISFDKNYEEILSDYDRDTKYWDEFYGSGVGEIDPSLFASWVWGSINSRGRMLELGCGNGRDSIFFCRNGISVTAIDASIISISELKKKYNTEIQFICGDCVELSGNYVSQFDYCYTRFFLHALNKEQERKLLNNVYNALKKDGKIFIETRCIKDELYGKGENIAEDTYIYSGHFRRFIRREDLQLVLEDIGYCVDYMEECSGFAPYMGDDPVVLRVVARKKDI